MWIAPSPDGQSSFSNISREILNHMKEYTILYLGQSYYGAPRQEQNYALAPYFAGVHILHYMDIFHPDVIVFFQSLGYLEKLLTPSILEVIKGKAKICIYTPVEGYPMTWDIDPILSSADLILVPSIYSQECLRKHGFISQTLQHGIDTSIFKPTQKPNGFIVGSITSDVWRKQLTRIIDAHKICLDKGFNFILKLITSTYDSATWQPRIKNYAKKINPNVIFNETAYLNLPRNPKAIARLYGNFNILAQPSTEAFGLTCLEGMASGVVPIIVNHGGSPEVVNDCGIYVKVKDYLDLVIGKVALVDVEDLAKQIIWAYQHPQEIQRLALKGVERAKQFNWQSITNKLENLLGAY